MTKAPKLLAALLLTACGPQQPSFRYAPLQLRDPRARAVAQNYKIRATRDYTVVESEVYFLEFGGGAKKVYPRGVEFDGLPMKNEPLDTSKEFERGCQPVQSVPALSAAAPGTAPPDKSVFTLFKDGYLEENEFVVTDEWGARQRYAFRFDPLEFAQQERLVLSRSKENLIKLNGRGGAEGEGPHLGIRQGSDFIDGVAARYDREAGTLLFPAGVLKKLKPGRADFWITSSDLGGFDTPGAASGMSNYIILFTDTICAEVVD